MSNYLSKYRDKERRKEYNREYIRLWRKRNPSKTTEYVSKWRRENPELYREKRKRYDKTYRLKGGYRSNKEGVKKYREKLRRLVLLGCSGGKTIKCVCCEENNIEFMTIDHVNGGGTKHRKEFNGDNSKFYRWIIKNNFPETLRVLCMNCNWAFGQKGYCPHKGRPINTDRIAVNDV